MKKLAATLFILVFIPLCVIAQDSTRVKRPEVRKDTLSFSDEYLDTVQVLSSKSINDYCMIGVDYGVTFANYTFSHIKGYNEFLICPNYIDVMFTHYEKLFGFIPNFAFRTGFAYAHEGFSFLKNPETGEYYADADDAAKAVIELLEIPVLAGFHVDFSPVKVQGEVGVYGGYRKSIRREGPYLPEEYENAFREYEFRWDYGLRGGLGFALMFDPIEIHFNALVRWGWQSLYQPDYNSQYYYRFAYPLDFTITAGVHFQLTKRSGRTSAMLRKQAKETVYGKAEDNPR